MLTFFSNSNHYNFEIWTAKFRTCLIVQIREGWNYNLMIFISFVSVQTCKKMFYLSDLTKDIKFLNWLFIPSTTLNINRLFRPSLCTLVQAVNKDARKIGILKSGSKIPVDMNQFCFYVSSSSPVAFSLESKTQLHRYLAVYIGGHIGFFWGQRIELSYVWGLRLSNTKIWGCADTKKIKRSKIKVKETCNILIHYHYCLWSFLNKFCTDILLRGSGNTEIFSVRT